MDDVAGAQVAFNLGEVVRLGAGLAVLRKVGENQLRWARSQLRWVASNNRFERSRGGVFVEPRSGVDDWHKSASLGVGAVPRRSTS